MDNREVDRFIDDMPDEVLSRLQFSMPWQYDSETESTRVDADGFDAVGKLVGKEESRYTKEKLQSECWAKFNRNPHINTAVRGLVGRMAGFGFETSSELVEIDEVIEEIELDPRNRLYNFMPKFVGRAQVEGELFLCLTCHSDGFIEVDFIDPSVINDDGDDDTGIIWHPDKYFMPLFYSISTKSGQNIQIPSVFVARYPELVGVAQKNKAFSTGKAAKSKSRKKKFRQFGGYYKFIVSWDKGFLTRRAVSFLRTTLEWLNHYENLKKYEIDHKKSSGAYLWVFKITEPRAFKQWLSLTDEDRRKTGIMAKKTPGGSLILPPGIDVEVKNPTLSKISEGDTDILDMIASGLNEPEDVLKGSSSSTYSTIKAGRGPMSDRTADEVAYFERFLKYDFWDNIFYLRSKLTDFKYYHKVKEAFSFDKEGEPLFRNRRRSASQLIDICFPTSELVDYEARAKGLMGTKHGPVTEVLGIPYREVAKRMGFANYGKSRLEFATEKEKYPELVYTLDAESLQETQEGESLGKTKPADKKPADKKPTDKKEK